MVVDPYIILAIVSHHYQLVPIRSIGLIAFSSVLGANLSTYKRDTVYIIFTRSHYNCINTPTTHTNMYLLPVSNNGRRKSRFDNLLPFVEDVLEYYWGESSGVKVDGYVEYSHVVSFEVEVLC